MPAPFERLVNLALFLADAGQPVHTEHIRKAVQGYPSEQDDAAFARMFERDKDDLRSMGLEIGSDSEGNNWLDTAATFAAEIELSAEEAAAIRVVGSALLDDPAFPFAEDLRFALAKIATAVEEPDAPVVARMADESPEAQGSIVAELERAITSRKRARFDYTNSRGERKHHVIDAYGLFVRDGRWYVVGLDTELDQTRVYAIARAENVVVSKERPKTPDFERPEGFDVATFIALPFQYGKQSFEALIEFDPDIAWRAPALTAGAGHLNEHDDGIIAWTVIVRDERALARWVVENGPGIRLRGPESAVARLNADLSRALTAHGGER